MHRGITPTPTPQPQLASPGATLPNGPNQSGNRIRQPHLWFESVQLARGAESPPHLARGAAWARHGHEERPSYLGDSSWPGGDVCKRAQFPPLPFAHTGPDCKTCLQIATQFCFQVKTIPGLPLVFSATLQVPGPSHTLLETSKSALLDVLLGSSSAYICSELCSVLCPGVPCTCGGVHPGVTCQMAFLHNCVHSFKQTYALALQFHRGYL